MKNKRISHLVFILILFLCAAILLGGKWIYDVNIAYRLESHSARHRSLIFEPLFKNNTIIIAVVVPYFQIQTLTGSTMGILSAMWSGLMRLSRRNEKLL